ncbi:MAG: hypothetical protein NT167_26650, partial [Verrucomicrobia bacterium]|nr:hypothetical protein [Verrucomicrobiota bacterium]
MLPSQKDNRPQTIVVYGFSILEPVITEDIFPAFQKEWFRKTGRRVELISSFAGSGTVANQLIMGVPAEIAILSTELDAQRLTKAGVVPREPHKGNGAYLVPKTFCDRCLQRLGCGALWKMIRRESFSICLSFWRSLR